MTDAEKKWAEFAIKARYENPANIIILKAYKQSLRGAIGKYLNNAMKEPAHQYNGGLIDAYKTVLEEMDRTEPPKQ